MDVVCQKSCERRDAHAINTGTESMTLHMHLTNQHFYLLITRQRHLSIPHAALKLPGCPDNDQLFHTTNSQIA